MKQIPNNMKLQRRGVGDCSLAAGHETYGMFFETNAECQKLVNDIYAEFKKEFFVKPNVKLTGRNTTRTMGTAQQFTGRIRLHNRGSNVAVLIHELAHLWKIAKNDTPHGRMFKAAQTTMLQWFEKNRDSYVDKNFKVEKPSAADPLVPYMGGLRRTFAPVKNPNGIKKGDRVWWLRKNGSKCEGTVTRMNVKTATIKDCVVDGMPMTNGYYRVSPSMLKLVLNVPESNVGGTVVDNGFKPKIKAVPKPVTPEPIEDTDEELRDMIGGLMDGLSKYAVGGTLSMQGITRCLWVHGIKNTDENRQIALDYIHNVLGLKIR